MVAGNEITRAGCWAHLRRKVIEAEKSAPEIAREAIEMMRALYVAQKNARYSSIAERLDLRQKQSAQVLIQLRQKLLTWRSSCCPSIPWPRR